MYLYIKTKTFEKEYLLNTHQFEYNSILDLVFELFSKHIFIDREAELYLYQLLQETGYNRIEDIPFRQLNTIVDYFMNNRQQFKVDYDEERLSYLLLAAIQNKHILTIIDKQLIVNFQERIYLKKDSNITFFKMQKLSSITFKSI